MEIVLVTGGAGFIGSNLARALLKRGYGVVILDDLSTGRIENIDAMLKDKKLTFVEGSILDTALLSSIIESNNISLISHQAACSSVPLSIEDPLMTTEVNVTGTVNIFNTAALAGIKRVVYASSSSVYGDTLELPTKETTPLMPKSPYASSKASMELYAGVFSDLYEMEIAGLRYFNVYGPSQNPSSGYAAVVPKFITRALTGEALPIDGDGEQSRDFVYIDDVVSANINALSIESLPSLIMNIACGERTSVMELARAIVENTGSKSILTQSPARDGDVRDSLADITLAQKNINYTPQYSISKGLMETIEWYKKNSDR